MHRYNDVFVDIRSLRMITPKEHHAAYEIAYQIVQRIGRVAQQALCQMQARTAV